MITIVLVLATVASLALGAGFAAVVIGIQVAEWRKSLPGQSGGFADAFARRVLRADARPQCPHRVKEVV